MILLIELLSGRVLCQMTLWIANLYTGLKTIRKIYERKFCYVLNMKSLPCAWKEHELQEVVRLQGGGIALLSGCFSGLMLLA